MYLDFNKLKRIYGSDVLNIVKENKTEILKNISYLIELGFIDIEDIIERYLMIFTLDEQDFKRKINQLITRLGENYVVEIESNLDLLESLL